MKSRVVAAIALTSIAMASCAFGPVSMSDEKEAGYYGKIEAPRTPGAVIPFYDSFAQYCDDRKTLLPPPNNSSPTAIDEVMQRHTLGGGERVFVAKTMRLTCNEVPDPFRGHGSVSVEFAQVRVDDPKSAYNGKTVFITFGPNALVHNK